MILNVFGLIFGGVISIAFALGLGFLSIQLDPEALIVLPFLVFFVFGTYEAWKNIVDQVMAIESTSAESARDDGRREGGDESTK